MAFEIKQGPVFLWLTMLSSMTRYGHRAVQGVRYLTGDQKIWSGNESYHLPRKRCEYLSGALERAHGILISVRHEWKTNPVITAEPKPWLLLLLLNALCRRTQRRVLCSGPAWAGPSCAPGAAFSFQHPSSLMSSLHSKREHGFSH